MDETRRGAGEIWIHLWRITEWQGQNGEYSPYAVAVCIRT